MCDQKGEFSMATQEEGLFVVEQTVASLRHDFLQAIGENTHSMSTLNKVVSQQEQNVRDVNHEVTILLGVISSQGKDIKDIKNRLDGFDQRFASIEEKFDQRFASVEGKLDQILLVLDTLTPKPGQEP